MRRIANGSQVVAMPARGAPVGTPGFGRNGNPSLGEEATIFDAEQYNILQEAIAKAIEGMGLTLDGADDNQLLTAVLRSFGAITTLSANTTLTAANAGLVLMSASGGTRTLTLPLANSAGAKAIRLGIARTDTTTANTLNLLPQGADTLNGLTGNQPLPVGGTAWLVSDGVTAWRLVASIGLTQIATFTASTTATAPWWARKQRVKVWGGGGGSGGCFGANSGGGPGAGGGYSEGVYDAVPGTGYAVTVANAVAGGLATASPTNGTAGQTSSYAGLLSATGGGAGGSGNGVLGVAGSPGNGSGGQINRQGGYAFGAALFGSNTTFTAAGGAGAYGGGAGGNSGQSTGAINGVDGVAPGGGAAGGGNQANGANGARGEVIVEWMP